jgi:phospholipase C
VGLRSFLYGLCAFLILGVTQSPAYAVGEADSTRHSTTTPIKHVVVVIGENHTFDNVYATYRPAHDQKVHNLLSEGIVKADGSLGPAVGVAQQQQADNRVSYSLSPTKTGPYTTLPQPNFGSAPDPRFPTNLANAPFQITKYVPYGPANFVGDPLHRFYQMWQQIDEGRNDLFVWAPNTAGDDNGQVPPAPIHQGGVAMGFYNVSTGDAPMLKAWADRYAISDNFHQAVMGGTGTNHVVLGMGDDVYFSDGKGHATTPPSNQIDNPNPKPGTNNNYIQDGYSGGTYSNCSDPSQPGVAPILDYVATRFTRPQSAGTCQAGHYYLLNNYAPGYLANGQVADLAAHPFTVPPSPVTTIADRLAARNVSWKYYGEGFNHGNPDLNQYCDICNPFQYATSIMTTPLRNNLQDLPDFVQDAKTGNLPAVSFVKPKGDNDGHPFYSTLPAFESFSKGVVDAVRSNRQLWKDTAIFLTFDEGGGYYDSGYIAPTSFFGDGTRVPIVAISPWAKRGFVDHTYTDLVSILKFIEGNWRLGPISDRSLDRLPNPRTERNPYVPVNGPAIGNLMSMFDFERNPEDG